MRQLRLGVLCDPVAVDIQRAVGVSLALDALRRSPLSSSSSSSSSSSIHVSMCTPCVNTERHTYVDAGCLWGYVGVWVRVCAGG